MRKMRVWKIVIMGLCVLFVPGSGAAQSKKKAPSKPKLSAHQRLEQFKSEVEKISGKAVIIQQGTQETNAHTACPRSKEIYISLNPRLVQEDQAWQDVVLAHELGHAYLCGKGFFPPDWQTTFKGHFYDNVDSGLIFTIAGVLSSCYLDPLAD